MRWFNSVVALAAVAGCQAEPDPSGTQNALSDVALSQEAGRDANASNRDTGHQTPDMTADMSVPPLAPDSGTCGARCDQCPDYEAGEFPNGVWCSTWWGDGYVGADALPYHGPARLEENNIQLPDGKYLRCSVSGGWGRLLGREVWADILETGGRDCECSLVSVSIREAPDGPPVLLVYNGDLMEDFPLFRDHGLTLDVGALCPRVDLGGGCPGGYRQDAEFLFRNPAGQTIGLFPFQSGRLQLPAGEAEVGLGPGYFSEGCTLPSSELEFVVRVEGGEGTE